MHDLNRIMFITPWKFIEFHFRMLFKKRKKSIMYHLYFVFVGSFTGNDHGLPNDTDWWKYLYSTVSLFICLIICLIGGAMFARTSAAILLVSLCFLRYWQALSNVCLICKKLQLGFMRLYLLYTLRDKIFFFKYVLFISIFFVSRLLSCALYLWWSAYLPKTIDCGLIFPSIISIFIRTSQTWIKIIQLQEIILALVQQHSERICLVSLTP